MRSKTSDGESERRMRRTAMQMLTASELREKYLDFFRSKGHAVISGASLVPDNDPTVLFTTAGMHPLVPYLLGEKHPAGRRLCDVQKCVRTGDIDKVGDDAHCTFFEMLGNWSLGDYFKKESISYSFEFLTRALGIPVDRLAVSVFRGDSECPRDEVSAEIWRACGIPAERIFYLPRENNWWGPAGATGPCGPDTEIFYRRDPSIDLSAFSEPSDESGCVEIWNNVFMEFFKNADGSFAPLKRRNVDTGMGLERTVAILNGYDSVYEIDAYRPAMDRIRSAAANYSERSARIVADHIRTSTFMLGDENGVVPSNVDRGYILRRLIRRAVRHARAIGLDVERLVGLSDAFVAAYSETYAELARNRDRIATELKAEIDRFAHTVEQGEKEFEKLISRVESGRISGTDAFRLYDTYGFPIEMTRELAKENGLGVDADGFDAAFRAHRENSRAGAERKFRGGLADAGLAARRLHTATHLLNAALKKILRDDGIRQRGSNITAERLRFDFNFSRPLTEPELVDIERCVNDIIQADIPVVCSEVPIEKAREMGAEGVFSSRYGDVVKVYSVGDFSMEICGGPHAARTGELGEFRITKEQSSSSGVRRIRAILKNDSTA